MKFCLQLNPQVAVDKPAASLLPTLTEQVRIADAVGFDQTFDQLAGGREDR